MALRLSGINRWCVSGTPVQRGLEGEILCNLWGFLMVITRWGFEAVKTSAGFVLNSLGTLTL